VPWLLLLLAGALACSSSADVPSLAADAAAGNGADAAACAVNEVPLLTHDFGGQFRSYVAARLEGETVALQLDTGSSLTFLYQGASAPDYTPDIASLEIGCEVLSADGRGLTAPDLAVGDGLEVVGLLGMDFLLERPALLDLDGLSLTRFETFPTALVPAEAPFVPFDDVIGHALVPCQLDGTAVRLMFDTGAGDTLWVGQEGRDGDRVQYVEDAEGTIFPVYLGEAELSLPGLLPRTVPVARAPAFPYFEETVIALGGDLHGLLGPTSFPGERLLFSGAEARFFLLHETPSHDPTDLRSLLAPEPAPEPAPDPGLDAPATVHRLAPM